MGLCTAEQVDPYISNLAFAYSAVMILLSELKELIALHATTGELGGDLKADTVNIIGATLDLQEKVYLCADLSLRIEIHMSSCRSSDRP